MNIALYGGSFDPPHLGHLAVVHTALERLMIDRLFVVPAFVNPFKEGSHAPAALRLSWLKAIFRADQKVTISDFEVAQSRPVRTVETVLHFKKQYEKIYFIIGADNLETLHSWHRFEELNTLVTWVVATRDNITIEQKYLQLDVTYPVSSTELRKTRDQEHLPLEVATQIKTYYEEHHAR